MNRLCVYCGSQPGNRPIYEEGARKLGEELLRREIGLVYGGASVGLMGRIASTVLEGGGEAIGVIPEVLMDKERAFEDLTELYVVNSMHERKQTMVDLSQGFVALPGGLGTAEEIFEVLTWAQLGFHRHPCGLLNVGGYYDQLVAHLDQAENEGFVRSEHRDMIMVEESAAALLDRFERYRPPTTRRWLDREQT